MLPMSAANAREGTDRTTKTTKDTKGLKKWGASVGQNTS